MMFINRSLNISLIVKDPENTGRAGLGLILPNVTNKAKNNQSFVMNLQICSIIIGVTDTILNKIAVSDLTYAAQKAPHQKQSP